MNKDHTFFAIGHKDCGGFTSGISDAGQEFIAIFRSRALAEIAIAEEESDADACELQVVQIAVRVV